MTQYRQGDLLLCRVERIPAKAQPIDAESGRVLSCPSGSGCA